MLVIRDPQAAVLRNTAFSRWMRTHLETFMPAHCEALGPAGTEALIARGIAKGHGYGLKTESELCQFVDLMFCFGEDFDVDPALPWARAILNEPAAASPEPRIDRLFEAAMTYLQEAARGP